MLKKPLYTLLVLPLLLLSVPIITMQRAYQLPSFKNRLSTQANQTTAQIKKTAQADLSSSSKKRCNNLIIILDPREDETINHEKKRLTSDTMTLTLKSALSQPVAPIITTPNIIKNVLFYAIKYNQTKSILNQYMTQSTFKEWHLYIHKNTDLVLLIPKSYLISRSTGKNNLKDQLLQCGFDTSQLNKIDNSSDDYIFNYIDTIKPYDTNIIDHLRSMFVKKTDDPFYTQSWNIYLTGHGLLPVPKRSLTKRNDYHGQNIYLKKDLLSQQSLLSRQDLTDNEIISTTGQVAGLDYDDFFKLISFFSNDIQTSCLFYMTCYGGGFNRTTVNDILSKLNVNFIVFSQGMNEHPVHVLYGEQFDMIHEVKFNTFFSLLEHFFCDQTSQQKISLLYHKDPFASIVNAIVMKGIENQTFIRIPKIGIFTPVSCDKKIKILTTSQTRAYEFENKNIDFTNPDIEIIIVYPSYIGTPLLIRSSTSIISPFIPNNAQKSESLHVFEALDISEPIHISDLLDSKDEFSSILQNFIHKNNNYTSVTFVIKKLEFLNNKNLKTLNIPLNDKKVTINNLVINIKSHHDYKSYYGPYGTQLETHINIAFLYKNTHYSIPEIKLPMDQLYSLSNKITLATPALLDQFGSKVLPINDKEKLSNQPLTLTLIVETLENNIDKTTTVQQPGALKDILEKKLRTIKGDANPDVKE